MVEVRWSGPCAVRWAFCDVDLWVLDLPPLGGAPEAQQFKRQLKVSVVHGFEFSCCDIASFCCYNVDAYCFCEI